MVALFLHKPVAIVVEPTPFLSLVVVIRQPLLILLVYENISTVVVKGYEVVILSTEVQYIYET